MRAKTSQAMPLIRKSHHLSVASSTTSRSSNVIVVLIAASIRRRECDSFSESRLTERPPPQQRCRAAYAPSVTVLVGRGPELAVVEELLGEAEPSLAALEVVGEPGIGKTTVWQEAVRRGEARGLRVLAARPAESEARLAFAALADLLETVGDEILALLPPPQRNAIDVALLRAEAGRAPSRRLVGTGLLSILRELTNRDP